MVSKSASKRPQPSSATDTKRFKGVRMRSWGKWVSEIRLPNTRARLWLGSYSTAEQAAHAFDVAVVCLRGRSAALNFPNSPPTYAPLGLPHHKIQELAASAGAAAAATSSSPVPSSCESAGRPDSDESEIATISCSSHSDASEASMTNDMSGSCSTTNEMSSSSCSCSSVDDPSTFAGLLALDEDNEQSSPLDAALQEHALNMGGEWDELLWSFPMTGYSAAWEEPLLLLPPLPVEDDLPTIVEPSLWSL